MASDVMRHTVSLRYAEVFLSMREQEEEQRINKEVKVSKWEIVKGLPEQYKVEKASGNTNKIDREGKKIGFIESKRGKNEEPEN